MVSWSIENMGHNLPTLISTLQGNLYELREFSGTWKLADLELPESFGRVFIQGAAIWSLRAPGKLSGVRMDGR